MLEAIVATAPTAAKRLGDAALFGAYLQLVNTLLNQVPRGLRPMLENLEALLGQLTLGGLRRWATWGAHAHKTNFEEQVSYFGLKSKESLAMLQKERKGTLFVDVQRRINMYLRALWARDFFMRPTSGDFESREGYKPYIEDYFMYLPDAFDDVQIGRAGSGVIPRHGGTLRRASGLYPRTDFCRGVESFADGGDQRDRGCACRNAFYSRIPRPQAIMGQAAYRDKPIRPTRWAII